MQPTLHKSEESGLLWDAWLGGDVLLDVCGLVKPLTCETSVSDKVFEIWQLIAVE